MDPAPKVRLAFPQAFAGYESMQARASEGTRQEPSAFGRGMSQGGAIARERVPEVLFVCVHNAGRSQMAAGLLAKYAGERVVVRSAGSAPAEEIIAGVVEVMHEVGVDLSRELPKPLTTEAVQAADVVITMGCGDACPVFPGKRYLDWDLRDPSSLPVEEVRPIRDEIDGLVTTLLAELLPAGTGV
jgi:arsenate reductase